MDTITTLFGQYTSVAVAVSLVIVAWTYFKLSGGNRKKPRSRYGIEVGPEEKNSTRIIRNWRSEGKDLIDGKEEGWITLVDVFSKSRKKHPNKNCLGTRPLVRMITEEKEIKGQKKSWQFMQLGPYQWETYEEVGKRMENFGSGLVNLGVKSGSNLAIYSETRAEWTIAANGCFTQNIVVLTVYANLGMEQIIHAFKEGEITTIVTNAALMEGLNTAVDQIPTLKRIIYTDELTDKIKKIFQGKVDLIPFADVEKIGSENRVPLNPAKSGDELALIMYTSGTTGFPKGVMLSHKNAVATMSGAFRVLNATNEEVHLSYLPLAHILAFIFEMGMFAKGAMIGYGNARSLSTTSVRNCLGDLEELKPTVFAGVPSVYDRLKQGIKEKINRSSAIAQFLFKLGYNAKKNALSEGKDTPLWNKLVFDKFKSALGGRVRIFISGGAPISSECCEFLSVCFGVPVCQGYGLTETCGGSLVREEDSLDITAISCGAPTPSCELKLVDVPEMEYTHNDKPLPRGEIWLRGPIVACGYYRNPEKTREEWTEDHWFKTGDIGMLQKDFSISIIDRKKNLVKPPHGEYISPERLESVYKNSPFIDNILVYASSSHNDLIAFVAPNKRALEDFASKKGLHLDWTKLCENKAAESAVLESLNSIHKSSNLKSMERISAVKLFPEEWTPENGWLTAAMKIRRNEIHKNMSHVIKEIYSKIEN